MNSDGTSRVNISRKSRLIGIASVAFGMFVSAAAQADTYIVNAVLSSSNDSGFAYSGFHVASDDGSGSGSNGDNNPMTGTNIDDITGITSGSYNDVSGLLTLTNLSLEDGGTVSMSGTLLFDSSGVLTPASSLVATFSGSSHTQLTGTATLGFSAGYVCCGSTNEDPNSFIISGDDGVMSLWGADSAIGLDIKLDLMKGTPDVNVPIPAAAWLFGSALLGLAGVARRKQA